MIGPGGAMMRDGDSTDRIERAIEGRLSPGEEERFREDVVADPALRAAYVDRVWLHARLRAERDTVAALAEAADGDAEPGRIVPWRGWQVTAAAAAVAVLAGLVAGFRSGGGNGREAFATLELAEGCRWAGSDLPTAQGSRLGPGTLTLVEGMAVIRFDHGARLDLEAPTTLQIVHRDWCRLREGSLVAEVPEAAHGFVVDTPQMQVKDLGTRFGVTASGVGNSHVLVFEGEVEVAVASAPSGGPPRRLTTGNSLHLGETPPTARDSEVGLAPGPETGGDGWVAVSTAVGRGRDAYVRRGDAHGPTGGHPLLMVKHTDLAAGNERRAILAFDLAGVADVAWEGAELVLDVQPSGLGFSSLVPDSRFRVYGVAEDAADGWEEDGVVWDSLPGWTDEGPLPGAVRDLGGFEIRRGAAPAQVRVAGPALAEFLRADKNRLVTLVLVRETGETESQGLVHAFAAREHPSGRPPTLRFPRQTQTP
jgi:ferric-dicitrate binding protein FerR (iron transport regulator)